MSYFKPEWISQYLTDTSNLIIFDVGSRQGEVGISIKNKFENSRIICIEADKRFHEKAIKMHGSKIEAYNYAVCDENGEQQFYGVEGNLSGVGSIHPPTVDLYNRLVETKILAPTPVKSIRLDSFCKNNNIEKIDVLHMDIQSAEYKALVGLGDFRPKLIFLEVSQESGKHYQYTPPSGGTTAKLKNMNYEKILAIKGDELWKYKL